ncbi:M43 family zinc metalloprotease [Flavilitoribacter nigricans]|uniref:MAM domain-containing protein n=1 Tax=Flavilitoribacter nigricans (strain ATCC 23147 / DSM 23189 / NBRC 102662 / NCIMB 1420 / SS-2) TaxID=1122177 RepID=A0A2D0N454_FLAN2|nr:M43 family zinc metalloprotease [Flavilitoribacter nigricans]PHN03275.1 hypothetical protein CRP01_28180 [Flavilitoribacter nigricans DSM 23189 = NBRC 102662]
MHLKISTIFLLLLTTFFVRPIQAQDQLRRCHTMEADAELRARYPQLGTLDEFEEWLAPRVRTFQKEGNGRAVSTIPIIFHIIHDGDAVGSGDNISALYVNAQIQQLNDDFRRILGTSGYNTHPAGADSEIEFCAAAVDPNGNPLSEPGINRINRNSKGWSAPPYGTCIGGDFGDAYIENTIKPESQWDPNDYLNVWVMDINCSILGYAQFPSSSGLSGLGSNGGAAATDGVVLLTSSLGSTGTPQGSGVYNKGRTGTHEIGHFFGLRHIWGDQTCGTDYCNDTPEATGPASGCPNSTTCDGVQDMVENYMDYSYDDCMNIFTGDQKARMQTVLQNSPRRGILANSTACTSTGGGGLSCASTVSSFPYNEGFESGFGGWSQSSADDFDWSRNSGGTPSSNTGPSGAAGGSWYVFTEASSPNYPSLGSILNSPCFDLSAESSASFAFEYHLYGAADMGGLQLQAKIDGGGWNTIWSVSGNQGNSWQSASVDLASYLGETVQLRFVGTTGATWQGDMGVDEISLTTGGGGGNPGGGGGCTTSVSTFPYDEGFESSFGDWSQDNSDDFDWLRLSGGTPSGTTGPSSAVEGSYYAYIESSSPNYSNLSAVLNGPCFDLSGESQATFIFQYHLYGASNMGSLSLEARPSGGNWSSVWSLSGNQGNSWQEASVNLAAYLGGSVELRFVGITGTTWQGDMAIDALELSTSTGGGGNPGTGDCTDVTLSITFDNYPEETSWEITDGSGAVVYSGGTYDSEPDGSTITLTGCIPYGCYDFTIFDAYGDGICCSYGNGSYSFTTDNGTVLASGSSFGSSETTSFCLSAGSREVTRVSRADTRETIQAFPNPTRDQLTVVYESKESTDVNWRIVDLLGKTIQSAKWPIDAGFNQQSLRVDHLPAGTYLLVIEHNGQPHTQRFVVSR